jgi:DNA replication protein DnaC
MNVHLLVLDDLGAERATEWVAGQLYTILNHRLINNKPTIVTTNLDTEELSAQLGQRTVERLKSYRVIHVGGGNLRDERRDD